MNERVKFEHGDLPGGYPTDFVPVRAPGHALLRRGDGFTLTSPDSTRSLQCDPPAALIWDLIDGRRDLRGICDLLCHAYALPIEKVEADVVGVFDEFVRLGAMESVVEHSFVTWDSSFRNAFHLLRSIAETDYDLKRVEVILVEQRSRRLADSIADIHNVASAGEIAEQLRDRLSIRVLYLDEPDSEPYHPGRLLNAGIAGARGNLISTMDADVLVPPGFPKALDEIHDDGDVVATIYRHQAPRPPGVTLENWTEQAFDYWDVLRTCPDHDKPIPGRVGNKAPMISTHRRHWRAIGGYDGHRLFSTAYTLFGRDVVLRLRLLLGDVEHTLPVACVHPWHPTEVRRKSETYKILYDVQNMAMHWARQNRVFDVRCRRSVDDKLYADHRAPLERAIAAASERMCRHAREPARAVSRASSSRPTQGPF